MMKLTKHIEEIVKGLEQLDSLPIKRRRATLNLFYDHLINGGVYDLSSEELSNSVVVFKENGLNSQAEKLSLAHNAVIRRDPEKDYNSLANTMPKYFAEQIKRGTILSRGEMKLLAKSNKSVVFDRLFEHNTAHGLGILPSYESSAMRELEAEILEAMQTYQDVPDDKSLRALRKRLGAKADIVQLKQVGNDFYTYEKRKLGAEQPTDGIEFKVAESTPIEGPRFMPHRVCGYYGILRFYAEEMAKIAPEGANAFLDGTGILRSVECGGMWSPIVQGNILRPIKQPEDQYHIVPVKFFNIEIDKSQKYMTDMEELPCKGGHAWREVVKPRGKSEIVSKDDKVFVIGS